MSYKTSTLLRYLLLGIASTRWSHCQVLVDEDEDEPDENEPDEDEPDEDESDEDEDDDEVTVSSALPPASASVPQASVPPATSVVPTPTLSTATSILPTPTATTPSAISSFSTSATSASPTGTANAAEDALSAPRSTDNASGYGLTTGAKAGIAVGVIVLVLAALGAGLFEWHRRRKRRTRTESRPRDSDNSTHYDTKSPRHSLNRFRRTTIDDHYAADSKPAPTNAYTNQEVYAHYNEKDGVAVVPGLARAGTERYELDAAVPTHELEGETDPKSPVGPADRTNTTLSPVSPLSNGTLSKASTARPE